MKVLIGIISKNRESILPKAIESALRQTVQAKQVAIFDDNSTDNTRALKPHFPLVDWYFSETNKGYVYGRNKLMQETEAEYFCSLDDDSWFLANDELQIACDYLDKNPNVAAIAFDILSPDRPNPRTVTLPIETNLFIGCGHVLRLSATKEVGFYIPFPGFYAGEERDLCIRLIDKGYKIVKLPGINVWHDKTMVARNVNKQCMSNVCNDLSYAYMRFPFQKMLISIPYKFIIHLRQSIKNGQIKPCFVGIFKFFLFLITFRLKRRPVSLAAFRRFQSLYNTQ